MKKSYVLGLCRTPSGYLMIEKIKPDWQKGRVNGLGGSIEKNEYISEAMVREFFEESGILTREEDWNHFLTVENDKFELNILRMDCLYDINSEDIVSSGEGEVRIYSEMPHNVMDNIPILTRLAFESPFGEDKVRISGLL